MTYWVIRQMTKTTRIRDLYFDWMYGRVETRNKSYRSLCLYLDRAWPFYWNVPNDDNREGDAIRERQIFRDEVMPNAWSVKEMDEFMESPVSVFEVLVAIALRMDFQIDDPESLPQVGRWFEELLFNLGIRWAVDEEFEYRLGSESEVDDAVRTMLDRSYDYNGNGSLFPMIERPHVHMAAVEIWYQMMWYIMERYPI